MSRFSDGDPRHLRTAQYRDGANLSARIALHQRYSTHPQGWHRWLFERIALSQTARVLDVGCGAGSIWRHNRERVPAGWQLVLADFSAGMLAGVGDALGGRSVARVQCDAQALPHPSGHFDAVLACHVLYHVPDRDRALSEIRRVLRPGGALFASTNGRAHMRELNDLVERHAAASRHELEFADRFGLRSGADTLARHFGDVELFRYDDALEVSDAEPLLAYIRSAWSRDEVSPAAEERMRRRVEARIRARGAFRIRKETGVFVARAPRDG